MVMERNVLSCDDQDSEGMIFVLFLNMNIIIAYLLKNYLVHLVKKNH